MKVAAIEYATKSEVIRDGLRALMAQDKAVKSRLANTATLALDAIQAD